MTMRLKIISERVKIVTVKTVLYSIVGLILIYLIGFLFDAFVKGTSIRDATIRGKVKTVGFYLFLNPAFLTVRFSSNESPFHIPCTDCPGESLLHLAAEFHQPEVLKLLVSKGGNINIRDHFGRSPLHFGVFGKENKQIVQTLLSLNPDLNCQDNNGTTPLHNALEYPQNITSIELGVATLS